MKKKIRILTCSSFSSKRSIGDWAILSQCPLLLGFSASVENIVDHVFGPIGIEIDIVYGFKKLTLIRI